MRIPNHQHDSVDHVGDILPELARKIDGALGPADKRVVDCIGLELYRASAPTMPASCSYEPSLLVVAQGRKRVDLGKAIYSFGGSTYLLTSLELPVISRVMTASKEAPYLAFFLKLDMPTVRDILNTEEIAPPQPAADARGMVVGTTTDELIDCCSRMLELLTTPRDLSFIGELLRREMTYRLLQSSQGVRLRAIATHGDYNHQLAKAVAWLRANYKKPLDIDALAELACMGRSTLHHHFRALTAMSPLQFQKQLRLTAARQRMLVDEVDATSAAFEVGYESASQFNREYRRFFGKPPIRDIQALRIAE